jgi:hypothetical protein
MFERLKTQAVYREHFQANLTHAQKQAIKKALTMAVVMAMK